MDNEYIGKRVSCEFIKQLYPDTWVAFDNYDKDSNSGTLVCMTETKQELRKFLNAFYKQNNRSLMHFPTTERGEYNFLCQL